MARRRGFFAELQHQAKVADQRAQVAARQHSKQVEAARKAAERASLAASRASEQDRKRLEREAAQADAEARQAEADEMTAELNDRLLVLDQLLTATLETDDFVDLETLRRVVEHPPFPRRDLEVVEAAPPRLIAPERPTIGPVDPVKGLFGRKKKAEQAQAQAEAELQQALGLWARHVEDLPKVQAVADKEHARRESARVIALERAREIYSEECQERQDEVDSHNAELNELIAGLGYGTPAAVRDYIDIVLGNSVYPEHFDVTHTSEFSPESAELILRVLVPAPHEVPTVNTFRYTKTTDEITSSTLSQKAIKDRYSTAIHHVALRSLHEIFEADRRGLIKTISLEVGTETINPATGQPAYIPFVAVGAGREEFLTIDLSAVVPSATLDHLGAAVSKNPVGLVPAAVKGVRRS